MSNQSPTANSKDQFPEPPTNKDKDQWSPEQPVRGGETLGTPTSRAGEDEGLNDEAGDSTRD